MKIEIGKEYTTKLGLGHVKSITPIYITKTNVLCKIKYSDEFQKADIPDYEELYSIEGFKENYKLKNQSK